MAEAYANEESPAAKNAIAQILMDARMAAQGHRPVALIAEPTGLFSRRAV